MRLCRISHKNFETARYAVMEGTGVAPLPADYNFEPVEKPNEDLFALDEVTLLAPVVPSKIVCVGRNYREHAAELGNKMPDEPLLFLKAPSAVIATGEQIVLPEASQQVEPGKTYYYYIVAVDKTGNFSQPSEVGSERAP